MWESDRAPEIARRFLADLGGRWLHVQSVGRLADQLAADAGLPDDVRAAAWLHDVGYAPDLSLTGFHPLDGAVYLTECGAPTEVVGLVAWHTGAVWEAAERGLSDKLARMPVPSAKWLDVVTLIDLVNGPDGVATTPEKRVAEILSRYDSSHPVHRAVKFSAPELLASSARARATLGLPDEWPLGPAERM
ncbi:HD domain-containing protein [Antribacter sp. KLBMP9083]|uniref:HD domain-containing protein n=1 Tax=Antribacter soli TaxID=2910976 RepID=A0AA41QGU4_9MICO|nr:HD domain-containing protein [Antribacter soli]MCF4123220.1 HD domain-containing protein [Antribacter soli]